MLDLCCGDGIWAPGIKDLNPNLTLYGIDLSTGGIDKARTLLGGDAEQFVVGDAGQDLGWADGTFDLIFVRGPCLFNQHLMDRRATIKVITPVSGVLALVPRSR